MVRREKRLRKYFQAILALTVAAHANCRCSESSERDAKSKEAELASAKCEPTKIPPPPGEEDAAACATFVKMPCGLPANAKLTDCVPDLITCRDTCKMTNLYRCQLFEESCGDKGLIPGAPVIMECIHCPGASGRRPLGLAPRAPTRGNALGTYFADMAHLESASVRAFCDLAGWLAAHRAPSRLTRAADAAAKDERRHARAASRLARRFGGKPQRPRVRRMETPSLLALLEDDAVEGCVGETYGALLATWQGRHAPDARVARTMRSIAVDETRHAALAWEILAWGAPQVSARARTILRNRLDGALAALEKRVALRGVDRSLEAVGQPPREVELRLVRELARVVRREAIS